MDRWRLHGLTHAAALLFALPLGCDDSTTPETGVETGTSGDAATSGGTESPNDATTSGREGTSGTTSTSEEPQATTDGTAADDSSSEPDDGSTGGADTTVAVSGFVTRSVEPGADGDATGTLYLSLMQTCETGASAIEGMEIADADLSVAGTNVPFSFDDVAPGTYQLTGFLDDNGNFDGAGPDLGDLVAVEGVGPGCVEVTVGEASVQNVALDLNFVMPF